jgi:hypothetical protein
MRAPQCSTASAVLQMSVQEQTDVILGRLREAMRTETPVMGRILNAVNRGYSVGVAGLVCFLPITQCLFQVSMLDKLLHTTATITSSRVSRLWRLGAVQTAARVGVLQPFFVQSIREDIRNVVLADAARLSLSSAASMYSRPNNPQAKPAQPRLQQRMQPAPVTPIMPSRQPTFQGPRSA